MSSVKRMLVATDGSAEAVEAIDWLAEFPLPPDAAVEVVTAVQLPFPAETVLALGWKEFVSERQRVVDEARTGLARRWPDTTSRLLDGDPRRAIVDAATTGHADLIVLGARGHGAVPSILLGSVSLAVTRHAPCPVLVCRGRPRPVRHATIALDGSVDARAALAFFSELPLPADLRVTLVGAVDPLGYPTSVPFIGPTLRQIGQDFENEARRRLEAALAPSIALARARLHRVLTTTPTGAPAATIVREAERADSDLIVVGARGLGMVERAALGSVSESVLRHATCPVLVVRPPVR